MFQLAIVHVQFIQPQRRALADRRQLGGLQMRIRQRGHVLVLIRETRQQVHHVEQLAAHDLQALAHDNHIGVVTHIAGRRAQMDDARRLRALQTVSVNVAHHVVEALLLAALRIVGVDVLRVIFRANSSARYAARSFSSSLAWVDRLRGSHCSRSRLSPA